MQIKLYIDGQKKTFAVPFVKARMLRRAIELGEQLGDTKSKQNVSLADIDSMVEFVVDLFNGQFSVDDLWDGLSNEEFIPELTRCLNEAVGKQPKSDPNVRTRGR